MQEPTYYPVMKNIIRRVLHTDKDTKEVMRLRTDEYLRNLSDKTKVYKDKLARMSNGDGFQISTLSEKKTIETFRDCQTAKIIFQHMMSWIEEGETYYQANDNERKIMLETIKSFYDNYEGLSNCIRFLLVTKYNINGLTVPTEVRDHPELLYY